MKQAILAGALVLTFAISANAEKIIQPDRKGKVAILDVIDIIPGESSPESVKANSYDRGHGFVIGGHSVWCEEKYIDEKLGSFFCLLGGEGVEGFESNTRVYLDFLSGFTKKFGAPHKLLSPVVMTRAGVKYTNSIATWKDIRGNELTIENISYRIDTGYLRLKSSAKLAEDAEERHEQENRKF
jgi:hypothetical protein